MIFVHEFSPMISWITMGNNLFLTKKKDKMMNQVNFNINTVKKYDKILNDRFEFQPQQGILSAIGFGHLLTSWQILSNQY